MKKIIYNYLRFCPKTGKFVGFKNVTGVSKLLLPILGLIAMVWILLRVIPKPSRISYPCVQSAMPFAAGFMAYLSIAVLSTIAFFRSKKSLRYYPLFFVGAFGVFALTGFFYLPNEITLPSNAVVEANKPFGEAKGIFPGRVVWVHNSNAINQECVVDALNHAWYMPENYNMEIVNGMVSAALDSLTGQSSDTAAWRVLFQLNNQSRGKGAVNYKAGEKIFLRINICSSWTGNFNTTDLSKANTKWYAMSETSTAMVLAMLHQLVDVLNIAQSDIYIGDPMKHIYKHQYEQWHSKYPNVHYLDCSGYDNLGREKVVASGSAAAKIYYADKGTILKTKPQVGTGKPVLYDSLYTIFEDAEYMINLPQLKGHKRAGMTMFAKNHFGSVVRADANHLHNGLPAPTEMTADTSRLGYGLYRVQVDLMTQSLLRKKNLLFIMDALWATDHEQDKPLKWQMAPFNNEYTASVFASLDNVAIESVGYDFLRTEFTIERGASTFVQMRGVDDYLHQAADSTKWPAGIKYDPDNSGVHIYSLGVHEHWNNATDKKYSRNLGTGIGIELLSIMQESNNNGINEQVMANNGFSIIGNYPNPFSTSTTLSYKLSENAKVEITIYDVQGKIIFSANKNEQPAGNNSFKWNGTSTNGNILQNGIYVYRIKATTASGAVYDKSAKMMLKR